MMTSSFLSFLHKVYRLRLWITRPLTLGVRLILVRGGAAECGGGGKPPFGPAERGGGGKLAFGPAEREGSGKPPFGPAERGGQVLLVRHTYQGGWLLPGGGVEKGETIEEAARREAREEVGAELGELRLEGVFTNFFEYKSDHVVVFACERFEMPDHFCPNKEIAEAVFFPLDALPADLLPGHRRRIAEYCQPALALRYGMW